MMYRYFIKLAYNGRAYNGWQIQPNAVSVQQTVENGLAAVTGVRCCVTGCGRTDSGVHAAVFYAHFDSEEVYSPDTLQHFSFRLNRFLPEDILIEEIKPVLPGAHARYSALWREYEYLIIRQKDPFRYSYAFHQHGDLDTDLMNKCASLLVGRQNFESFSKVHTQVNNFNCEILTANWETDGHLLKFTIRADRFLRNMVRAIVGTLLDAGRGKLTTEGFQIIINSRSRSKAGYSVPARGLTLTGVGYPDGIFSEKTQHFLPECGEKIISHYYADSEFHQRSGHEANEGPDS